MTQRFESIDAYIATFPPEVQAILEQVRSTIHGAVPGAGETISYHMPTITVDGSYLVAFAGWKKHIALYPAPSGDEDFEVAIAPYRTSRSTASFPLSKPIPYDLVARIATVLAAQRAAT